MKGKSSDPAYVGSSNALRALQLTKISLLILFLGICVVGKRKSTWPIVSWSLYSGYSARFRPPEPSVSAIELRVYTTAGELYVVKPEHVLTMPRDSLSHKLVEHAFNDVDVSLRDASRRYLRHAVSNLLPKGSEIETIQAWKNTYPIEPLSVPPIELQAPTAEVKLGSFSEADLMETIRQEKDGSS